MNDFAQTGKEYRRKDTENKSLLEQIAGFVEENLSKKLTLKMVALQFGVSISTVTQLFQKKTKTTFHGFVTERRMAMARMLILQGVSLETVGKEVGYQDHSTFYRAFRQTFGVSPREFRKNMPSEPVK